MENELNPSDKNELTASIVKAVVDKIIPERKVEKELSLDDFKNQVIELQKALKNLDKKEDFRKGDLVEWKPLLKNRNHPEYSQPAIVIEVLQKNIVDAESDAGSPFFKETLNIKLGMFIKERFLTFYYDKNRFQHYKS